MQLSAAGRARIQRTEGFSLKAYPDTKKGWSIGYGHFGAKEGDVITKAEADRLFAGDIAKHELNVSLTTPVATQPQFDAMVALSYNVGTAGFAGSTVARLHNARDYQGAGDAFRMWNLSDGGVNPVLVRRREDERGLYLYGYDYSAPHGASRPVPKPKVLPLGEASGLGVAALVAALAYLALPRIGFTRRMLSLGA